MGRLFHRVVSVVTFIVVKINLCLTQERVHLLCHTRACLVTTVLVTETRISAILGGLAKG